MAEKKGGLKGFFGEFKQFITRGNVMDMASASLSAERLRQS